MKIEFTEVAGASRSTALKFQADNPADAAILFTIYEYLRGYHGDVLLRTPGTSGTLDTKITV